MLAPGETEEEIFETMDDLRAKCGLLTLAKTCSQPATT
jgi:lipoate synthase